MSYTLKYQVFGDKAVIISWPQKINNLIRTDVHQFNQKIQSSIPQSIAETVPAYCSLTLFLTDKTDTQTLIENLKILYQTKNSELSIQSKTWEIPVCYDTSFGIDLEILADLKNFTIEKIIHLHSRPTYVVDFIGFLPGFPYLSGLDPMLETPRLSQPRIQTLHGSVAIGGKQTGIYPVNSPGGWHIIGSTPINLFNPLQSPPCLLKPLDKIKFKPITMEEYRGLLND